MLTANQVDIEKAGPIRSLTKWPEERVEIGPTGYLSPERTCPLLKAHWPAYAD